MLGKLKNVARKLEKRGVIKMYSKEKDDKCWLHLYTLSLILFAILLFLIGGLNNNYKKNYGVNAQQCIGSYDYYNDVVDKKSNEVYLSGSSKELEILDSRAVSSGSSYYDMNISALNRNININGFAITVDNSIFGYVLSEQDKDIIVKSICDSYIRELGINVEDISYMKVNGNIKTTPSEIRLCQLGESSEISREIYEASIINKNLLELELCVRILEEESIDPPVIVEDDSNMYMGEESVIEGEEGRKSVFKEVVYDGLTKTDETILSQRIVTEPVATVVYKGIKNPYYDDLTFLSRPIRGGYISSFYGEARGGSYHKGVDIAQSIGENIMSAFEGKVIFAGYNDGGYGNLVIIQHSSDMKTYYAHLSQIYVSEGQEVKNGDLIGAVGSTGYSTGPHLHFELRINDVPVNPINYIIKV